MDEDKLKKIIEQAVKPIQDRLADPNSGLAAINQRLNGIDERLDGHGAALVRIESTLKGYADMYKINNSNAKKLEKRIETLEENAELEPPPELTLAKVS